MTVERCNPSEIESIRAPATSTIGNTQIRNGTRARRSATRMIATYTNGVKSKSPVGIAGWPVARTLCINVHMAGTIP